MWFSAKVKRKMLAEQLVLTHQSAAIVIDAEQQFIATNEAFNQLSRRMKLSDHNQTFTSLRKLYNEDSKTIHLDAELQLSQSSVSLTVKDLESCSLYVFEAVPLKILSEQAWQQLLALYKDAYVVFDKFGKLVIANLEPINAGVRYLDQADKHLLQIYRSDTLFI
mgnify:FL=1